MGRFSSAIGESGGNGISDARTVARASEQPAPELLRWYVTQFRPQIDELAETLPAGFRIDTEEPYALGTLAVRKADGADTGIRADIFLLTLTFEIWRIEGKPERHATFAAVLEASQREAQPAVAQAVHETVGRVDAALPVDDGPFTDEVLAAE